VFVSTNRDRGRVREDDDLTATGEVYGGYAQTKWASERLLRLAGGRFGPVVHYRLGLITGDTRTGRRPGRDLFTQFIRGLARIGGHPAGVGGLSLDITPVDYAAAALARISLADQPDGATFHLANPRSLALAELLDLIREAGVRLEPLPAAEFRERAVGLDPAAAAACLGLCRSLPGEDFDRLRATDLFQATGSCFDQTNTVAALNGSGIACPPPEPGLIRRYVVAALDGADPRPPACSSESSCPRTSGTCTSENSPAGSPTASRSSSARCGGSRSPGRCGCAGCGSCSRSTTSST
jgi:hypothetical protein